METHEKSTRKSVGMQLLPKILNSTIRYTIYS